MDREKNINEIQLGNVKNQVLGGGGQHHHHGSLLQNSSIGGANPNLQNSQLPQHLIYNNNAVNFSGNSIGMIAGREIDRNQLSVEIMNITPIMEEKEYYHNANNAYPHPGCQLNEFKIDDEPDQESGDTTSEQKISSKMAKDDIKYHKQSTKDNQQMQDDQNQFSFDKELNYFNPDD